MKKMINQTLWEPPQLIMELYEPEIYRSQYDLRDAIEMFEQSNLGDEFIKEEKERFLQNCEIEFCESIEDDIVNKYGVLLQYNVNPYRKFMGMSINERNVWEIYVEVTFN